MGTPSLSINSMSVDDGVEVVWNGQVRHFTAADIAAVPGNLAKKEQRVNEWAQEAMTTRFLIADYEPDHRYRQVPPVLRDYEYVDGPEICIIQCYIAVHIFELGPPVRLTVRTSKEPISGDWWL